MTKNANLQRSVIETSADGEEGLEWTGDLERHSPKKLVAHKEGGIEGKYAGTWMLGAPKYGRKSCYNDGSTQRFRCNPIVDVLRD